ncbi:transposase [Nesterenkonia ebinurensis]|uniref:transposase n=1 Tax=Nesterenkonia ebinurensis TaxID=2608252 RepID=UPI00123CFD43|nr:transposase [Nesterenkonia ebinurensis]
MPALPSFIIEPLWEQFDALLPEHIDTHPLGCHNPRISDRIVFNKLVQVLVLGAAYAKIADSICSATTIRRRRDEWIDAGVFEALEQICLEVYDQIVGLDLGDVTVDGCIVKAPCGGEVAGRSPVDRGKQGTKRSVLTDGNGIPLACVVAPANRQLLDELGCNSMISVKGFPLQAGRRWVVERLNSWHNHGFKKLLVCTERRLRVINALIALANAAIIIRCLTRTAWTTHRWDTRPARQP